MLPVVNDAGSFDRRVVDSFVINERWIAFDLLQVGVNDELPTNSVDLPVEAYHPKFKSVSFVSFVPCS